MKIQEVYTLKELLSGDLSKYRLNVIHEGFGLISVDYYGNKDDGSNLIKHIELTLQYEAPYATNQDKVRIGQIITLLETIIDLVNILKTQSKITELQKNNNLNLIDDKKGTIQ